MNRLTEKHWRNLDPRECCGQDNYCQRGCHEEGGCNNGCIVPRTYNRLSIYEDIGLTPEEIVILMAENSTMKNKAEALTKGQNSLENINFKLKKALELACEHIYSGGCAHCPLRDLDCANDLPCEQSIKLYFLAQAKAGDRP